MKQEILKCYTFITFCFAQIWVSHESLRGHMTAMWRSSESESDRSEVGCWRESHLFGLRTSHYSVSVERLHVGDDSVLGRTCTVAALRRCKALERLMGHILRQRWDAKTHTRTEKHEHSCCQSLAGCYRLHPFSVWDRPYLQSSGAGPGWGGATGSMGTGGGK